MKPRLSIRFSRNSRHTPCVACLVVAFGILILLGCAGPAIRSQSPDDVKAAEKEKEYELVGDVAGPFGTNYIQVESVALVTGLPGTGSDPPPSPARAALVEEMQRRSVENPNKVLASTNTSLVLVRALIPPGAQKGDRIDVEVRLPPQSETTSLRGGWLMETRLKEMAVIEGRSIGGHELAISQGPLLVDPQATGEEDRVLLGRAMVLGGGIVLKSRQFGLGLRDEARPNLLTGVRTSSQIGKALNARFHLFNHGTKEGVANPQTDGLIELAMHPRYKDNIPRYLRVVRSVALKESSSEQLSRLELLEAQLLNPITAASAAIKLEAIGKGGIKTLRKGLDSQDPEVRFYSAEALAYLDEPVASKSLGLAAREEPAFRAFALAALSTLNDVSAYDELRSLLDVPSSETRYGAFRAIWAMNPRDPLVRGESLGDQFSYHVLATAGPPMIHVAKTKRPEIVLFGPDQYFEPPLALEAGKSILINAHGGRITVSKFAVGEADQKREVSTRVDDVIRAIIDVGGSYPDVVQALQQAKSTHSLPSRLEFDAIPEGGRIYDREPQPGDPEEPTGNPDLEVASPLPGLFSQKGFGKKK